MSVNKTILVVDDEPDFASIVKEHLQREGFTVDVAYDGSEAIAKVAQNPPDAIVMDVMMPEKDGYQACAELKADKRYAGIPVVLLTAVAEHVTSTRYSHHDGMTTEADDYIAKPATAEQIVGSIKRLLKLP